MPQPSAPEVHALRCLIIADDLTGSCDAAVHFARNGMTVAVPILGTDALLPSAHAVAVNTDSRRIGKDVAANRVKAAIQMARGQQAALFKKIDSSLRGHISAEIAAAAEASHADLVFIAPALPALGRRVTEGRVRLPSGEAIDIAAALAPLSFTAISTGELTHPHKAFSSIQQAQARGTKLICFDASSDQDLDRIVDLGHTSGQRILWVGSAGLAAALARSIAPSATLEPEQIPTTEGPVLFGVGSDHNATLAQLARLRTVAHPLECSLETVRSVEVRKAIQAGHSVLLHLPPCGIDATKIQAFAEAAPLSSFGGIVLTGGDTASTFLKAIGAHTLHVRAEAMPGIPVSIIRGGLADGTPVITKSGAFGPPDTLLQCIEFLSHSGRVVEGTRQ